MKTPQLFNR